MSKFWPATELTGGAFGALDAIDGNLLVDGGAAIVVVPGTPGITYTYTLDADSGAAEDVPNVIAPDLNPGDKRWLLQQVEIGKKDYISFNPNPSGVPTAEGTMWVDPATKMPAFKPDIADSIWNAGLESWTRVRNETGATIENGQPVFGAGVTVSPDTGELVFLVVPALAVPGQVAIPGIATSDIPHDSEGFATTRGTLKDVDLTGFNAMEVLYLSDTPGTKFTKVPPSPPNYPIAFGYVMAGGANGKLYAFTDNPGAIVLAVDAAVASGDPTGFHDNDNIQVDYDPVARTIILTGNLKYSFKGQVKELTSPWTSAAHDNTLDEGFFLYSTDGENFVWTSTPWAFTDIMVAFVYYGTNDKFAVREVHGLMGWQNHEEFHQTQGTYKQSGGGLSEYVEDSTTAADRRPNVAAASIKDEDIRTINPALTSGLYTQAFLSGSGIFNFVKDATDIVPLSGNQPYFNEFVDPNWQQTLVSNNEYMSVWLVAIPAAADSDSQKYRYIWIQGQTAGTLTQQRGLIPADLSLGNLKSLFNEFVFLSKVILRYTSGNWRITEVEDITGTQASTVSAPSGNYLTTVSSDDSLTGEGTPTDPLGVVYAITGNGPPSVAPTSVGQTYVDTTSGKEKIYKARGTSSVNDWEPLSAPKIYDNGTKGVDTEIDWRNGSVQIITLSAIIELSFTGWDALPYASNGTLIIIGGATYEPKWTSQAQIEKAPTYTADKSTWLELASLEGGDIYTVAQFQEGLHVLDSDLITNGDMSSATGWIVGAQWAIAGGVATCSSGGAGADLELKQDVLPSATGVYYIEYEITARTAGFVRPFAGATNGEWQSDIKTHREVLIATTDTEVGVVSNASFVGSVDNVIVKRLL